MWPSLVFRWKNLPSKGKTPGSVFNTTKQMCNTWSLTNNYKMNILAPTTSLREHCPVLPTLEDWPVLTPPPPPAPCPFLQWSLTLNFIVSMFFLRSITHLWRHGFILLGLNFTLQEIMLTSLRLLCPLNCMTFMTLYLTVVSWSSQMDSVLWYKNTQFV